MSSSLRSRMWFGAAVVALAMTLGILLMPRSASAKVDVGGDLHVVYDGCIAKFRTAGLGRLVDQLDASNHVFEIRKSNGTISNARDDADARNGIGTGGKT